MIIVGVVTVEADIYKVRVDVDINKIRACVEVKKTSLVFMEVNVRVVGASINIIGADKSIVKASINMVEANVVVLVVIMIEPRTRRKSWPV